MQDQLKRFMSYVTFTSSCWIWNGAASRGYGKIRVDDKILHAHVLSWMLFRGEVPDGHEVMHHCDNRACVNPAHLDTGTHVKNMQDMVRKGRSGAGVPKRQMTTDHILQAKKLKAEGKTFAEIKQVLGFDGLTLWRAVHNKTKRAQLATA